MPNGKTAVLFFVMKKFLLLSAIVLGGLLAVGIGFYAKINTLRNEGIPIESGLNAQYLDNQNQLSAYISEFYETVGVANLKSDKMDTILVDAMKGRYEGNSSAQVGRGQLFSSIKEAYPNLDLSIYDRIIDLIHAGREHYKQAQSKLLDMLRSYDNWRSTGIVQSWIIKNILGFPSERLEARIGTQVTRGAAARDQMYLIVTTADTQKAYQTGTMDPLQIPGAKPAAPAPAPTATPAAAPVAK